MRGPRQGRLTEAGTTVYEAHDISQRVNPRNPHFKGFRPAWLVQASQRLEISPEDFKVLRTNTLYMSREQCAAYLRVDRHTVWQWETGRNPIPFIAYELLRLLTETMQFKIAHSEWEGWSVNRHGELCNPDGAIALPIKLIRNYDHVLRNVVPELRRQHHAKTRELELAQERIRQLTGLLENSREASIDYAKDRIRALLKQPAPALLSSPQQIEVQSEQPREACHENALQDVASHRSAAGNHDRRSDPILSGHGDG